jgi:hypothetical protein
MTRDEYIKQLKTELKNQGVKDYDAVVAKYNSRFDLAKAAGFTEEEACGKFKSPAEVAASYKPKDEKPIAESCQSDSKNKSAAPGKWELVFSLVADNIAFSYGDVQEPYVDFNDANPDNYQITKSNGFFKLEFMPKAKFVNDMHRFHLKIVLPEGQDISSLRITTVYSHINFTQIRAEELILSLVNGTLDADDVRVKEMRIAKVAGRVNLASLTAEGLKIEDVGGVTSIGCGEVDSIRYSTVSGRIEVNSGHIKKSSITGLAGKIIINGVAQKSDN